MCIYGEAARSMGVTYSIGARFAGGGIGNIAYHAVRGYLRHNMLHRLLCGSHKSTEVALDKIRSLGAASRVLRKLAVYDRTQSVTHLHNLIFDLWASQYIEPATLFHVWNGFGLRSLRKARSMSIPTVVERASSHPLFQANILAKEYHHWGLNFSVSQVIQRRNLAEIELADYVLIPSDFVRQSFLAHGFPENKLIQVPFGVDTDRFRPAAERPEHPFRVLFVGQVGIRKGLPYLLDAWQQLVWKDAELWVVGRPCWELSKSMAHYRTCPGLHLVGFVSDPVTIYQEADVFAFPSIEEGSALVTYEALACGLPVVTTPNSGSVIRDGEEGFIIPVRDIEALATALEKLRSEEATRRRMSHAARRRAKQFSWRAYEDTLAGAFASADVGK